MSAPLVVVELPDERLTQPCVNVTPGDEHVAILANLMVAMMHELPGCVGIAANQVGVELSLFVVDVSAHKKTTTSHGTIVMANPSVVEMTGRVTMREGCLSVPHFTVDVPRAERVTVVGIDPTGRPLRIVTEGFEARALLHEIDHLGGRTIIDRAPAPSAVHRRVRYLS